MEAIPLNMILIKHTINAMVRLPLAFDAEPGIVLTDIGACSFTVIVAIIVQFVFLNDHIPVANDCIHVDVIFLQETGKMQDRQELQ